MEIRRNRHQPTVTIVCETFNHATFLPSAIEGFLSQQTEYETEILFHDDASTDKTQELIQSLEQQRLINTNSILQIQNQYSKGIRPHRFSFRAAKGEYIALCEGDDYWTDPHKLQKQIAALERHPNIDICVHPAMRLSMRTGKLKKGFDYGHKERIVDVTEVISRHNQFAPTASVLMRTQAAQNLPDWFFDEPGLPVGDFFIEAILGRKGILYLPDTMSVYRRGVPGSYTNSFRQAGGQALLSSLERMLHFTERLRDIPGIPQRALDQRLSYIRLNYALQFLAMGDTDRFALVSRDIQLDRHRFPQMMLTLMRNNKATFRLGRWAFKALRQHLG